MEQLQELQGPGGCPHLAVAPVAGPDGCQPIRASCALLVIGSEGSHGTGLANGMSLLEEHLRTVPQLFKKDSDAEILPHGLVTHPYVALGTVPAFVVGEMGSLRGRPEFQKRLPSAQAKHQLGSFLISLENGNPLGCFQWLGSDWSCFASPPRPPLRIQFSL